MRRFFKAWVIVLVITLVCGITVFAAGYRTQNTNADTTVSLDEYKTARLEALKEMLDARVSEGLLSQEEADEMYAFCEENIANCNGSGACYLNNGFCLTGGCGANQQAGRSSGMGCGRGMASSGGCGRWQ